MWNFPSLSYGLLSQGISAPCVPHCKVILARNLSLDTYCSASPGQEYCQNLMEFSRKSHLGSKDLPPVSSSLFPFFKSFQKWERVLIRSSNSTHMHRKLPPQTNLISAEPGEDQGEGHCLSCVQGLQLWPGTLVFDGFIVLSRWETRALNGGSIHARSHQRNPSASDVGAQTNSMLPCCILNLGCF